MILKKWRQTAAFLLIFLSLTVSGTAACAPIESQATVEADAPGPTASATAVSNPTSSVTAVSPTAIPIATIDRQSFAPELDAPTPTPEPRTFNYPTATPTPTPPVFPTLPSENSVTFTLADHFGGVPTAVLVENNIAYLGVGPRLALVDISNPAAPQFIGQSPILGNSLRDIAKDGAFIYGAAGRAGLVVLDVSDPAKIEIVNAGPNYSEANPLDAQQVALSGGRVFVRNYAPSANDLIWFELPTASEPQFSGSLPLGQSEGFGVAGDLLFLPAGSGIRVAPAQNPDETISRIDAPGAIHRIRTAVQHNTLYLSYITQNSHLVIFDLTNPAEPQFVSETPFAEFPPPGETAVTDHALITSFTFGEFGYCTTTLTIFDIRQPDAPQQVGDTVDPNNCMGAMTGSGDFLYVAGRSGLRIFDTRDPANLQLVGSYTNPLGVQIVDDFLPGQPVSYFLSSEGRGSKITAVDLSQATPTRLGKLTLAPEDPVFNLLTDTPHLIAPIWNRGLAIFDTASPQAIQPIYTAPADGQSQGNYWATAVVDNVVYMPVQDRYEFVGELGAFDLQDPTNPQLAGTVFTGLNSFSTLLHEGNTLYLLGASEPRELVIINISSPLAPQLVSRLTLLQKARQIAVVNDMVYAACEGTECNSLTVIDVTDKERPFIASQWELPYGVGTAVTEENRIYYLSGNNTLWGLDVSDPVNPKMVGTLSLPGWYSNIELEGSTLYVSAGFAGLMIVNIVP
ncbi:LVIVD repeat-containing protein [Candidatus Leptofilum sp.]|uniref:LVIVD repeat-containing protein n=1 Tax=Candidatus Leptofilum sp. TaxID=3241576 RepID=UPI003B591032